jgi:transcriptional regulator with XRE-family HTH domain
VVNITLFKENRTMSQAFIKKFGENVKRTREAQNLSQEELAHKAGLHRTQISLIERGGRAARLDTIERLAKALEIQPSKLMPPILLNSGKVSS